MSKSARISSFSPGMCFGRVLAQTSREGNGTVAPISNRRTLASTPPRLVGEEDRITLTVGVDAQVEFGV